MIQPSYRDDNVFDAQRKIKRLFIVDPNICSLTGHYLTYAGAIAMAARARGLQCFILGHDKIDSSLAAAYDVVPAFRADIWHNAAGGDFFDDANLEIINREFFIDTCKALNRLEAGAGDVIFYPTLTAGQIAGIADLVEHFAGRGIRHEILLRYQGVFYRSETAASAFRRLERAAEKEAVRLSSDSHRLAYEFGLYTTLPVAVFPIPHTVETVRAADFTKLNDRPLHFVSLGNARGEKGLEEIFEAIRLSADETWGGRLRFTLQVNDPSEDVAASVEYFKANSDSRAALISETLDEETYLALLRSADGVLVPYHRDIYEARTSGVFLEASAAGKIVIATADTWMSDFVDAYGHGLLIRDRSARDLCQALQEIAENSASFAAKAQSAAQELRKVHNPDSFLDHLLGSATASAEPPRRKRAAIFYPWGDILGRSGAASRTKLLAKYLTEKGRDVRILYLGTDDVALAPRITVEAYDECHWHAHPLADLINGCLREQTRIRSDAGVHIHYHIWPNSDEAFKRRCLRLVRWADEIFVEYSYFAGVVGEMAARESKPSIVSLYDLVSEIFQGIEPLFTATRALEVMAMRRASRIVISNEAEARICRQEGLSVSVIPHPVDIVNFGNLDDQTSEMILEKFLGLSLAGRKMCFFVGSSFGPNLVAAAEIRKYAEMARKDPRLKDVVFVIAGAAHNVERSDNFIALGRVEDIALEVLYRTATIVLIPLCEGTGASVKTVEALARGACIISTSVGVRGYPVVDGEHCIIENDIALYPDRIAELFGQPEKIEKLRKAAKAFGCSYDYRRTFTDYGIEGELTAWQTVETHGPHLAELLSRLAGGSGTLAGLQWLLERLTIDKLGLGELAMLAKACHRLCPDSEAMRQSLARLRDCPCESIDDVLSKWALVYVIEGASTSSENFLLELASIFQRIGNAQRVLRRHLWRQFEAKADAFIVWVCRAVISQYGALSDPEVCYIFALASEREGGQRREVINFLDRALEGGFDGAWTLFHRGRLRLSGHDPSGRHDLEKAIALGGDAAQEAQSFLAWRAFNAGNYAEAVRITKAVLTKGKADPVIHYLLGLSLHALGRLTEARDQYESALAGGFDPAWILFHRGRLRLSEGDPGGRNDLEKAIELGGDAAKEATAFLTPKIESAIRRYWRPLRDWFASRSASASHDQ